jgi:4-amino-4-deoxy-L-arabinose transferase-like glycosyltransferase
MRIRAPFLSRMNAAVPSVREGGTRAAGAPSSPATGPAEGAPRQPLVSRALVGVILFGLVAVGLWLRLRNNDYGLPYVYNYDEAQHFVKHSVHMLGGDLDPGYFQNPSGYTYLIYAALRIVYGILGFDLEYGTAGVQFGLDPTPIWDFARTITAFIAIAGVLGTFWLARRFWGARVALVAAALMTFAFLPVVYSRIAVTDVGTFLPVAIAMYGALRVYEDGRLVHYLVAGAGIGLATGFKYTAGLVILPLLLAGAVRILRDRETPFLKRREIRYLIAGLFTFVLCFAITTPYFFADPVRSIYQLREQATAAGSIEKLGQAQQGGFEYYLNSFGWGFGWAAFVAALAGVVIEFRRDRMRALLLVIFPIALYLYMSTQTRYFGRWLLMMYPLLAVLAGVSVVRLAELVRERLSGRLSARTGWALSGGLAALITALILIQPLAADIRTSNILGREDTRQDARKFLRANYPDSLRIVIEPAVPEEYYKKLDGKPGGKRRFVKGFTQDLRRQQVNDAPLGADTTYASTLSPENIDAYRSQGFCLVMTVSLTRGRAENAKVPQALAYYKRLEAESTRVFHASPFKEGAKPVPLHFDFSYNYYPTAYARPGGVVDIYKLDNCHQKTGRVPLKAFGTKGLEKGIGSAYLPQ